MCHSRNLWGLLICLLLLSCDATYRFSVDGVTGEFCIPKTGYVAPGVWFVPEDAPGIPQGFSFGGCHRLGSAERASCELPDGLISADVDPLSERRNEFWSDLKDAALFDMVEKDPSTKFSIDPESNLLVVHSHKVWESWFVWKRGNGAEKQTAIRLMDSDQLVTSCSRIEDYPRSAGLGGKGDYGCERYVRGLEYALTYRFVSKTPSPGEKQLKQFEAALFDQVDRWRCPK